MPTMYQLGCAGFHKLGTTDCICLLGTRRGLQDLTGSKHRSNVGVRTVLHDNIGSEHKVVHDYKVSGWGCRISRVRQTRSGLGFRIRVGLQALTGKEQQFQHAYEVSGRGCRISLVGNIRSNMPTMYQVGNYRSYILLGIRRGLQDLTGSKHQIERAY